MKRIGEKIQLYGTSWNLFDLSTRDRAAVKNFLYPVRENNDKISSSQEDADKLNLPFPLIHPKGKFTFLGQL